MCFVPALFEITAVTLLAPLFFNISYIEAAIMGSVLAAVSPAVIVPRMIHLIDSGYGKDKSIPQLIMAGASVDDIFVIVLFASFMGMYGGEGFNPTSLLLVPVSIISGMGLGIISGFIFVKVFKAIHVRDTVKALIMLSIAFLFVSLEDFIKPYFPVSGLLAVMAFSATILSTYDVLAKRITGKFSKIWVAAEVLLFVLVGAAVDISYLKGAGIASIVFILSALAFRIVGVNVSLLGTSLDKKERIFCSIAYLPKATVQAAIGAVPLAAGVGAGNLILTVAVVAILISAPLGAIGVDNTYKKLLHKSKTAFSQIP